MLLCLWVVRFEIEIYNGDYNKTQAQRKNILEKNIYDGPSANLRQLFVSDLTKVYIIMCYAKHTTSDGPSVILRPLYRIYFCHITIDLCLICARTIRNCLFKNILFFGLFPTVMPIEKFNCKSDHKELNQHAEFCFY